MKKSKPNKINNKLQPIKYGTRPKVLLLGNGINNAYGGTSWSKVLGNMSSTDFEGRKGENISLLPAALQAVIYTGDNVDEGIEQVSESFMSELSEDMDEDKRKLLNKILSMNFDAVLTTNYSYDIEKAYDDNFNCKKKAHSKYRETAYAVNKTDEELGLFKYMKLEKEESQVNVWHIHGEAARPKSMIIGHYYYGKVIARIQSYMTELISRKKGCDNHKVDFKPRSWVDYFMIGDVYIVGLGLDPSEIDLWWLINCKKRNAEKLNGGSISWFEPNLESDTSFGKKKLAEVYNVNCITEKLKRDGYRKYYESLPEKLEKSMGL